MKKILLVVLAVTVVGMFAGCQPYTTETNTTFSNVAPIKKNNIELTVNRLDDIIEFQVTEDGYVIDAEEYIFRNDNTHELYNNYGSYGNIVFNVEEDGYYSFGFYRRDLEIIYSFKLSELQETQTINY